MQPWLPSVSLIRWFTQGLTINEYDGNNEAFPSVGISAYILEIFLLLMSILIIEILIDCLQTPFFDSYTYALSLFGWGGKTKWYCFYMLLVSLGVFRVVMIVASVYQTTRQRGQRHRKKESLTSF